jgi:hypothetical protein
VTGAGGGNDDVVTAHLDEQIGSREGERDVAVPVLAQTPDECGRGLPTF